MRLVAALAAAALLPLTTPATAQVWPVGNLLIEHEAPGAGWYFGDAVAAGDLDGDGDDDLVVGAPYYDHAALGQTENGLVRFYFGAPARTLSFAGGYRAAQSDGWAGAAVAVGNFDCSNARHEVAVGAPAVDAESVADSGLVWIYAWSGSSFVLQSTFTQNDLTGSPAEADDLFGWTLAAGDFDGDGCDDLAIGSPFEDDGTKGDAGLVHVLYGDSGGLTATGHDFFFGEALGGGSSNADDYFGWALAAGDFDGDGYDDLAIGAPERDVDGDTDAGEVQIAYGTLSGLTTSGSQRIDDGELSSVDPSDLFGLSLAAGDFDDPGSFLCFLGSNCAEDLAIGVPGQDLFHEALTRESAGVVRVLYGDEGSGLVTAGFDTINEANLAGFLEPGASDLFGQALAAGAVDYHPFDGPDDLLIGAPSENLEATDDGVAVLVLGGPSGPDPSGAQLLRQRSDLEVAPAESSDRYGTAMVIGDFDGDGWGDVAIGASGNEVGGGVQVLYGAMFADGFEFGWTCDWDEPLCL